MSDDEYIALSRRFIEASIDRLTVPSGVRAPYDELSKHGFMHAMTTIGQKVNEVNALITFHNAGVSEAKRRSEAM